jgi:formylglycine-generating enzyme required for sulfatase activity
MTPVTGENPDVILLLRLLTREGMEDPEFLRDALWLAQFVPPGSPADPKPPSEVPPPPQLDSKNHETGKKPGAEGSSEQPPVVPPAPAPRPEPDISGSGKLYPNVTPTKDAGRKATPVYVPASGVLPQPLELARALRPFSEKFRSRRLTRLDVDATVEASAERRELTPVLVREKERWFSLSLLVDEAPSMAVWRKTARELARFLGALGIFRDVRTYAVDQNLRLTAQGTREGGGREARPKQLTDPSGRTLIVVLTNGVGQHWQSRELAEWLAAWARSGPVAICSLLPPIRWQHTDLGPAYLWARASSPGAGNRLLTVGEGPKTVALKDGATAFPVLPLTKRGLEEWAAMQMSRRETRAAAVPISPAWFDPLIPIAGKTGATRAEAETEEDVARRVAEFRSFASPEAARLLELFSGIPLSLPVMRLVQHTMMPESPLSAMAEVLLSGLVVPHRTMPAGAEPEGTLFEFTAEARTYLRDRTNVRDLDRIQREVRGALQEYIERRAGISAFDFETWVDDPQGFANLPADVQYFAQVTAETLRALGYRRRRTAPDTPGLFVAWDVPELEHPARELAEHLKRRGQRVLIQGGDEFPAKGSVLLVASREILLNAPVQLTETLAQIVESGLDGTLVVGPGVKPEGGSHLFFDSYSDRDALVDAVLGEIAKRDLNGAPPVTGAPLLDRKLGLVTLTPDVAEVDRLMGKGIVVLFSNENFQPLPIVRDLIWARSNRLKFPGGTRWLRAREQAENRQEQLIVFEKPDGDFVLPAGCSGVLIDPAFQTLADLPDSTPCYEGLPEAAAKVAYGAAEALRKELPEVVLADLRRSPRLVEVALGMTSDKANWPEIRERLAQSLPEEWPRTRDSGFIGTAMRLINLGFEAMDPVVIGAAGIAAALRDEARGELVRRLIPPEIGKRLEETEFAEGPDYVPEAVIRKILSRSRRWPEWNIKVLEAMGVLQGDWFDKVSDDVYARQNLIYHLLQAGNLSFIERAVTNFSWWALRIGKDGAASLVSELLSLPGDDEPLSQIRAFLNSLPNNTELSVDEYAAAISRSDLPLPQTLRDGARVGATKQESVKPEHFILLAGSRLSAQEELDQVTAWAADAVAREIANRGLGLICGIQSGSDSLALQTFIEQRSARNLPPGPALKVVTYAGPDLPFHALPFPLPPETVLLRADDAVAVAQADAVVLLGGFEWVRRTGTAAIEAGKRIFPVPGTGGASEVLFHEQGRANAALTDVPWAGPIGTKEDARRIAGAVLDDIVGTRATNLQSLISDWARYIGPDGDRLPLFDWRLVTPALSAGELHRLIWSKSAEERVVGFSSFWLHPERHDSAAVVRVAVQMLEGTPSLMERYIELGVCNVALLHARLFPGMSVLQPLYRIAQEGIEQSGVNRAEEVRERAIKLRRQLEIVAAAAEHNARLAGYPQKALPEIADSERRLGRLEPPYGQFEIENHLQRGPGPFLRLYAYAHLCRKPNADLLDLLIDCLIGREDQAYGLDAGLRAVEAISKGHPLSVPQQDRLRGIETRTPAGVKKLLMRLVAPPRLPDETGVKLEVVHIAAQSGVVYRDDPAETNGPWVVTRGQHEVNLPTPSRIGVYPVTNRLFQEFILDGGYSDDRLWERHGREQFLTMDGRTPGPSTWRSGSFPEGEGDYPVSGVCFYEASACARWLQRKYPVAGFRWSIPPEDLWEFCARGTLGSVYPWGNEFVPDRCNCAHTGLGKTCQVTQFPLGRSALGCHDMAGNVWEFVIAGTPSPGPYCVLRGGSYRNTAREISNCFRLKGVPPNHRPPDFGFRCALVADTVAAKEPKPDTSAAPTMKRRPVVKKVIKKKK